MIKIDVDDHNWVLAFPVKGEHAYNYGPQSRAEALWRTMIMNEYEGKSPASITCGFGFSEWVSNHLVMVENIARHLTTRDLLRVVSGTAQETIDTDSDAAANGIVTAAPGAATTLKSSSSLRINTSEVGITAPPTHPPASAPASASASQQPHPSMLWRDKKFQKWKALTKSEKTTFFSRDTLRHIASKYFETNPSYQRMCADHGEQDASIDLEKIGGLRYLPAEEDLVDFARGLGPKPGETTPNALSSFGKLDHERSKDHAGFESRMRKVQVGGGDGSGGGIDERRGGMRLFCTGEKKLLGNGPCGIEVGDQVWVIRGMGVAVVLRPQRGDSSPNSDDFVPSSGQNYSASSCLGQGVEEGEMVSKFRLISETYLHGIARVMWAMSVNEGLSFRKIRLI